MPETTDFEPDIPVDVLRALGALAAGAPADLKSLPATLQHRATAWRAIMCGNEPWERLGWSLPRAELEALCRGLVTYFALVGISGGSVSPVIVLHRAFAERFPNEEPAVTAWIVDHRRNAYEPFGTMFDGDARSVSDFNRYRAWRDNDSARRRAVERMRQEHAAEQKKVRLAARATEKLRGAVLRGNLAQVQLLFAQGAHWQSVVHRTGSLVDAARQHGHTALADWLRDRAVG